MDFLIKFIESKRQAINLRVVQCVVCFMLIRCKLRLAAGNLAKVESWLNKTAREVKYLSTLQALIESNLIRKLSLIGIDEFKLN